MITTVIPVYNGERFLRETVESLLNQTRPPDRVIFLDNCSTDGTRDIFEEYKRPGFEWRQNERNLGQIGNLNKAHEFATETDYLHVLTDDDPIVPRFYEKMVGALASAPAPAMAFGAFEVIDDAGQPLGEEADLKCFFQIEPGAPPREMAKKDFLVNQSELHTAMVPAVVFKSGRRACPAEFRPGLQIGDCVFYADMARACNVIYELPEVMCRYRRHGRSVTSKNQREVDWALIELPVMLEIAGYIDEGVGGRWLRKQKLLCYFAARSWVKARSTKAEDPLLARKIERRTRAEVSWIHWSLGRLAVCLRDGLK